MRPPERPEASAVRICIIIITIIACGRNAPALGLLMACGRNAPVRHVLLQDALRTVSGLEARRPNGSDGDDDDDVVVVVVVVAAVAAVPDGYIDAVAVAAVAAVDTGDGASDAYLFCCCYCCCCF